MIDFLTTPMGIWTSGLAVLAALYAVGVGISVKYLQGINRNPARGEIGYRITDTVEPISVAWIILGLVPALFLSGHGEAAWIVAGLAGTVALFLGGLLLLLWDAPDNWRGIF